MRSLTGAARWAQTTRRSIVDSASVFLRDTGQGLLEVSHNSLALLGLVFVALLLFLERPTRSAP